MKNIFSNFDVGTGIDYKKAWRNALFVFDTNALLNLYRYRSGTSTELIKAIEKLSDRVWIPHHVGLEFMRNRLKVVAEQGKLFNDVRRAVEKAKSGLLNDFETLKLNRRHSLINPESMTSELDGIIAKFFNELSALQAEKPSLSGEDPLKEKIESIFSNRVGKPPKDQLELDEIYKQADKRFKSNIPPGYMDSDKDKDSSDEHLQGGIIYKRKFADYLIWRQILSHAQQSNATSVVLVTDDRKEDWWWKVESDGPKTIGPRPELVEEARSIGHIETFLMYNSEGFLKYAKEFLEVRVSEETLKEVREVSAAKMWSYADPQSIQARAQRAELAVFVWLQSQYQRVEQNRFRFPDFIAQNDGKLAGFEVKIANQPKFINNRLREIIYQAYYELNEGNLSEITIVWVVENPSQAENIKSVLRHKSSVNIPAGVRMIIGTIEDPVSGESGFFPIESLP